MSKLWKSAPSIMVGDSDMPERLTTRAEWQAHFERMGREAKESEANPYMRNTLAHDAWENGHRDSLSEVSTVTYRNGEI